MQTTIGTRSVLRGRRPRIDDSVRQCERKDCDTRLSRYNLRARCHAHRRIRFPRFRGRPKPRQSD